MSVFLRPDWHTPPPLTVRRSSRTMHTGGRSDIQDPMLKVPLSHPCLLVPSLEPSWSPSWRMCWEGGPPSWPLLGFGSSVPSSSVPHRTVECSLSVELSLEFPSASLRLVFLCTSPRLRTITFEGEWFPCNSGLSHGKEGTLADSDCRP